MLMQVGKASVGPLFEELRPHLSPSELTEVRKITDEIRAKILGLNLAKLSGIDPVKRAGAGDAQGAAGS